MAESPKGPQGAIMGVATPLRCFGERIKISFGGQARGRPGGTAGLTGAPSRVYYFWGL